MTSHQTVCVSPSCPAPLEPSTHCQSVAGLSFSYSCYFDICSSELEEPVLLAHTRGSSTGYSNRLHDFSVIIRGCYKDVYINSFFSHTPRLWNSLHAECFPLTYDSSMYKCRYQATFFLHFLDF